MQSIENSKVTESHKPFVLNTLHDSPQSITAKGFKCKVLRNKDFAWNNRPMVMTDLGAPSQPGSLGACPELAKGWGLSVCPNFQLEISVVAVRLSGPSLPPCTRSTTPSLSSLQTQRGQGAPRPRRILTLTLPVSGAAVHPVKITKVPFRNPLPRPGTSLWIMRT